MDNITSVEFVEVTDLSTAAQQLILIRQAEGDLRKRSTVVGMAMVDMARKELREIQSHENGEKLDYEKASRLAGLRFRGKIEAEVERRVGMGFSEANLTTFKQYGRNISLTLDLGGPLLEQEDGEFVLVKETDCRAWNQAFGEWCKALADKQARDEAVELGIETGNVAKVPTTTEATEKDKVRHHDKNDPFSGMREDTREAMIKLVKAVARMDRQGDRAHEAVMSKLEKIVGKDMLGLEKHIQNIIQSARQAA